MSTVHHVYVGAVRSAAGGKGGVFRHAAGSRRWDALTDGIPDGAEVHAITVHPEDTETVFAATTKGVTYHLHNVALLHWYTGAAEGPATAYSFPDPRALTDPARPCPARQPSGRTDRPGMCCAGHQGVARGPACRL